MEEIKDLLGETNVNTKCPTEIQIKNKKHLLTTLDCGHERITPNFINEFDGTTAYIALNKIDSN